MTRRGLALGRQLAAFAVLAVLALSLSGDRTSAAGVPATVYGQDPLEVLELKVRPNVIVVLDSSGSMTNIAPESFVSPTNSGGDTGSGDHPRSKLWQGKQVLKQIVQNNQDKVSFQFGTYTQYNTSLENQEAGTNRFQYVTSTMPSSELTVRRALGDSSTSNRGLQSWQIIYPAWGTLHFEEDAATDAVCTATLTGLPRFYAQGSDLATALAAAMNGATCTGSARANTYSASYATGTGIFTISRTGSRNFRLVWNKVGNNIANAVGGRVNLSGTSLQRQSSRTQVDHTAVSYGLHPGDTCVVTGNYTFNGTWTITSVASSTRFYLSGPTGNTSTGSATVSCPAPTGWATSLSTAAPWTLLYRTTGTGTSNTGLNTRWTFTESIAGVDTKFYQLRAGRLWNGEVVRVDSSGAVCGMDFTGTKTKPPSVTVQAADASCTPTGASATFSFAGEVFAGNDRPCRGFRSKSSLVPCDLQSPPAQTQLVQILPYLEGQLPFNDAGDPQDLTTNDATGAPGGANYGVPDGLPDYQERQDGSWGVGFIAVGPSAKADGWTPIANSLIDIKGLVDGSDRCLTNAAPVAGTYDPNSVPGTVGACVERGFSKLWNQGQTGTTSMAGPGPWQLDAIKNHKNPKEKTIVLFVTDGDDTCLSRGDNGSGETNAHALRAAYYAERLYTPLVAADPASSVQTYVVGYGGAFVSGEPTRLNWIAWGGSGLGQGQTGQPDVTTAGTSCESAPGTTPLTGDGTTGTCAWSDTGANLAALRAQCTTCQDAYVAPDAATLAAQLQAIIDQGASSGDFNAQQSITESVFEYVDRIPKHDARMPSVRYQAIVPTLFISSFTLPGFHGQLKAYQNDGSGNSVLMWSAGDKLWQLVSNGMNATSGCPVNTAAGVGAGECVLPQLHGGASDSTIASSTATIKRRIYTTSRNGVYTFDPAKLMAGTSVERVSLWPPDPAAGVLPADYSSAGPFDAAMGFPPDTPTTFPPTSTDKDCKTTSSTPKSYDQCWLDVLQHDFKACLGSNLPAACATTQPVNTQMRSARREARDISLAFMAGAATVPDGAGIKRTLTAYRGAPAGSILYKAREWVLGDSELATAAVVTPPSLSEPALYADQYRFYRDGAGAAPRTDSDLMIRQGFGLTQPDNDGTASASAPDTRSKLKPVMTVVYAPANDMLHAFRAGPSCSPAFTSYSPLTPNTACAEGGGEELWGFVPYDQLEAVRLRAANEPQGRANHVFMLARGVRFADVFVPGEMKNVDIGGETIASMPGVWRRVIYFGRGIGGKYVTALDVTAPGPYTATALSTVPPVPLWSRGNPDTQSGVAGTTPLNGSDNDQTSYARMGETWSMPTVAYVNQDKTSSTYVSTRRPDPATGKPSPVQFALFMGSGYGNPNAAVREGTTHYTLDALSGDVLAAKDVEEVAATYGLTRSLSYPNAIVANSVSFNRSAFVNIPDKVFNMNPHPWSQVSVRVYVGDLHGRLWKILTDSPEVVLPAADFGADQPVGTAAALMGEPIDPINPVAATMIPNIFVTAGADKRAAGPFRSFSLRDDGTDADTTTAGTEVYTNPSDGSMVTTYLPVHAQFSQTFDQGDPMANCGYATEAVFRGTVQPTSAVECDAPVKDSRCTGNLLERVFFGGTRLSLPNTKFAPPTPLACSTGQYPCRSQFDSIIYALGVKTGQAAYDLNASGDDAYRIFRDSRIAAISFQADPDTGRGGSRFVADEGLMKSTPPKPPPPPGIPPTTDTATANVIFKKDPGQPAPGVQYGSTVCQ